MITRKLYVNKAKNVIIAVTYAHTLIKPQYLHTMWIEKIVYFDFVLI